jgi:nucleoside-diphosphate-sugar epimerase
VANWSRHAVHPPIGPGTRFSARRPNPLEDDLEHVLAHTLPLWEELRGGRLFITGGTGFFGCWLLESFVWACDRLDLDAQAVVLTRRPEAFAVKAPHLAAHPAIQLMSGDVRSFVFPDGPFSHVIHAATESSTSLNEDDPLAMLDTIIDGTRRTLDFAVRSGAKKFLLTSSGAVYGKQPPEMTHVPEDYPGAPDCTNARSAYGEGKRVAELLCAIHARKHGLQTKIARCFAFVGPYLPLDAHFAVGNFIRDGLAGGPIRVNSDGTPYRSYLYAADLAIWLWTILFRGEAARPYNVGSGHALNIAELAEQVAGFFPSRSDVVIAKKPVSGRAADRYVPSVERAVEELGVDVWIPMAEALRRTIELSTERLAPQTEFLVSALDSR